MKDLIRFAVPADAGRILEIYAPYITDTVISFEYDVPSLADFTARVERISSKYPYLVYELDGLVVGYAYASPYIERAAYDYTVDLSVYVDAAYCGQNIGECLYAALLDILAKVYVDAAYCGQNIGECLYAALLDILAKQGFYNAYACITATNQNSLNFHKRMGFTDAGTHPLAGFKHGKWLDVCWYYKRLQADTNPPQPLKQISSFNNGDLLQPDETYKK